MTILVWVCLGLALAPALLVIWNLYVLQVPARLGGDPGRISILIPARNEEARIGAAIDAALASQGTEIEVLVLDDGSTDATAAIVRERAERDPRVRLIEGRPLPQGFRGKTFACQQLADAAGGSALVFVDADVCLAPHAARSLVRMLRQTGAGLLSGIPRQITTSFAEKLVVPLLHFVLLGYLPIAIMRRSHDPALGAACGQLLVVDRKAYAEAGGHAAVATKVHDGIALARRFRAAGFRTELADVTTLATCHMYDSAADVVAGFAKNAHEGLGSPRGLVPWTFLIGGGHVLPAALLPFVWDVAQWRWPLVCALAAGLGTRLLLAYRFDQSWLSAVLHPLGTAVVVVIQWYALLRRVMGRPVLWKQRDPTLT